MKACLFWFVLAMSGHSCSGIQNDMDFDPLLTSLKTTLQELANEVVDLRRGLADLGRQTMMQQFGTEEGTRLKGNSGVLVAKGGSKSLDYFDARTHVGVSAFAVHDHNNYRRTIGLGELAVAMNGVTFRTRHNDYKLVMPSTSSNDYHAVQDVPLPRVPRSVKGTVKEQVAEMKEWFRAFHTQNSTHRDYRKYFTSVLCYLEGAWTEDKELVEPFISERHNLNAFSWKDLEEKIKFTTAAGFRSTFEDYAFLPRTISSISEVTGLPHYSQWNYRILCQPTKRDIPLSAFKQVDDLSNRLRQGKTLDEILDSSDARFVLRGDSSSDDHQLLDELFANVPGKDNVPHLDAYQMIPDDVALYDISQSDVRLNPGFYHRRFRIERTEKKESMYAVGGFHDENLWVAQTNQPRVSPVYLEICEKSRKRQDCEMLYNRFSYALPLEVVYLTPLLSWNPFGLKFHEYPGNATTGGRDGKGKPLLGIDFEHFYMTPLDFYRDDKTKEQDDRGWQVKDQNGNSHSVMQSGTSVILNVIPGVGRVRLRYPIAPVHGEGSSVWKELNALKEKLKLAEHSQDTLVSQSEQTHVVFEMSWTRTSEAPGPHTHYVIVPIENLSRLENGKPIEIWSSTELGHAHFLKMVYNTTAGLGHYIKCDSLGTCRDGHPSMMFRRTDITLTMAVTDDGEG